MEVEMAHSAVERGARLRDLRKASGLNIVELAAQSEVGINTLYSLEQGNRSNPKLNTLERIAEVLGVDVRELL